MPQRRDPKAKKAKDLARQRKRACNSSDKAARKHAPKIKALASRSVRRSGKLAPREAEAIESSADQSAKPLARARPRHWGSDNAAMRRAKRCAERAVLDATAGEGPQGRRRAMLRRLEGDQDP